MKVITSTDLPYDREMSEITLPPSLAVPGRLSVGMCPGRQKEQSSRHWKRDFASDLDALERWYYTCANREDGREGGGKKGEEEGGVSSSSSPPPGIPTRSVPASSPPPRPFQLVIVSLMKEKETHHTTGMTIDEYRQRVEERGHLFKSFPIRDKSLPASLKSYKSFVLTVVDELKKGSAVHVHCNGGRGRAPFTCVGSLCGLGLSLSEAVACVKEARGRCLKNPLQRAYLKMFFSAASR
mmetsp:Transcript_43506/g.113244  ORF Transcript_43506/g.113244 Transcript_43506/m.113244 type:complete len:239 (-) Transcript_43506:801-1517(-)